MKLAFKIGNMCNASEYPTRDVINSIMQNIQANVLSIEEAAAILGIHETIEYDLIVTNYDKLHSIVCNMVRADVSIMSILLCTKTVYCVKISYMINHIGNTYHFPETERSGCDFYEHIELPIEMLKIVLK